MKRFLSVLLLSAAAITAGDSAFAQRDAGSKIRGEYDFYGGSAKRSMRGAAEYSRDFHQYVQTAPEKKVNPEVAKEATDSIGAYITKAQKHMAWMRKQAAGDKETLASLDVIDKNLADATEAHKEMCEACMKESIDAMASMDCCKKMEKSLSTAITEHDKLMKRLASEKAATK